MPARPTIADVKLKVNVRDGDIDIVKGAFGLRDGDAIDRKIWFYEHVHSVGGWDALPLLRHDLIVRVRRSPHGVGDVTVKVRSEDVVLPDAWCAPAQGDGWNFKIEGDWAGRRHTVAASFVVGFDTGPGDRRKTVRLEDVVMGSQLDFLHRAAELPIDVRALRGLGPIRARTWKPADLGFEHTIAAERWRAGDLSFLELSLRVAAGSTAADVQVAFGEFLTAQGVPLSGEQETKTRLMLEHLTRIG